MARARRRAVRNPVIPRLTWVAKNYPPGVLYYTIYAWFTAAGLDNEAITMAGMLYDMQDPDIHHEWLPDNLKADPEEVKEHFLNFAEEQSILYDEENTEYDKYLPWLAKNLHAISKKPLKRANKAIKAYYHGRGETAPDIYPIDLLDAQYASDASSPGWTEMMMVTELIDVLLEVETALSLTWELRDSFGTTVAWAEEANINLDDYTGNEARVRAIEWARTRPKGSIVGGDVVYEFGDGWTFQELKTKRQLRCEGDVLVHCVKSYKPRLIGVEYRIFSLRDPDGQPVATMQWSVPEEYVVQYYGLSNKIPERDEVERAVEFRRNYIDKELLGPDKTLRSIPTSEYPRQIEMLDGELVGIYMPGTTTTPGRELALFTDGTFFEVNKFNVLRDKITADSFTLTEEGVAPTYEEVQGMIDEALMQMRAEHVPENSGLSGRRDQTWVDWGIWLKTGIIPGWLPSKDGLLRDIYQYDQRKMHAETVGGEVVNPRKRRKAKRKKTPEYKRLLNRSHRLWETYDAKPLKKHLVAFGKHIEKMKKSESAKVKAESRRAARAFNAEFKVRGWKK